ncbi:MAG: hypothetical protein JSW49_08490 [candidate division WOR-3 bacterium]|nr:MAG: hypothetical protein JSW49_08490 [candidate division WOR-3 bacterium]
MKSKTAPKLILAVMVPVILSAQIEKWVYTYNGNLDNTDIAYALACGLEGNIYVAGRSANFGTSSDFLLVSLTDGGDTNWVYKYNPANLEDIALSVVYGQDGNIYAAGMSSAPLTYSDFTVLSVTTSGDTNWTYLHDGPSTIEDYDVARTITYGLDGNIYVGGNSMANFTGGDFFVVSLNGSGMANWTYRYGGIEYLGGAANSIVFGADSNIYAAGHSFHVGTRRDFVVLSLTTTGDTNWTYRYDGALNADEANSVTYGLDGNIYAAGYSTWIDSCRYFTVISLSDDGDENWVFRYKGGTTDFPYGTNAVVYGLDNNIYAAGQCSAGPSDDFFVVSLSTAGDTNWTYRLDGSSGNDDFAVALAYGSDGNIYACGMVNNTGSAQDFTVVSLDGSGIDNWIYYYAAEASYPFWDRAHAIDLGLDGSVYAAGFSHFIETDYDFTVISLDPTTGVEETKDLITESIRIQAAPNPFSKLTTISFGIEHSAERMELNIYDASGRLVNCLYRGSGIENKESVIRWDGTDASGNRLPGGVYFAGFQCGNDMTMGKLLLVR